MNSRFRTKLFALSAALGLSCISSLAADRLPAPIQSAVDSGLKFERSFEAAGNLDGWILSKGPGNHTVLFTSKDGEVGFSGVLFNAQGANLNKQYLEKYAPKPDYEQLWSQLESSSWISQGTKTENAKSVVYIFEDANCGYCHLAWKALSPYTKAGLQIRWIPVAFLAADSMPKAIRLLSSKDGDAAIAELHANFGKKLLLAAAVDEVLTAKVEANANIMQSWGFNATPSIFYRDASGKVRARGGMPNLSELPAITGLPEQPNSDPDLADYR